MYTIENHLEHLSHGDDKCKTIYSIWNLNKQNLKRALSTIQINFPHYSIHDYSHADTIIQNIELYLGHERIKTLSITDSWLILMSAYTHDIGMIVFMKNLESKLNTPDFIEDLIKKSNNRYDSDLADAAKTILSLIAPDKIPANVTTSFDLSAILKIKKSITLLSAELFRKIHHEQSKNIISGIDESFANEFNKFYSNDIPVRFLQVLGDIAYSHGIDFYETLDLLPQKSNGYASDYMHPRFIACMLRLGDLLDVDDKRFNQFTTKVFDKESVKHSALHEKKHASVKHLLVTPESIEAIVDCKKDEKVFRIANQWFDYLKKEIEHQNREWSSIRPGYLQGLSPSFSKDKIVVLFNGKTADIDLMNLQFNISREKTFEIFEGSALYDNPSLVFLREITQNAVDATKIQLWKDIEKGVYNSLIKENLTKLYQLDTESWDTGQLLEHIKFPDDIPSDIYKNYDVKLEIKWADENHDFLSIVITDKGCGINKSSLLRMCKHVGDSRKKDVIFQELKERMPFFLKPTGAFGLGLQSIFLVADEFEIKTKNEDDNGWNIIFRSAKKNEYISVTPIKEKMPTGTLLKILLPSSNLEDLFSDSHSSDALQFYDRFTDQMGGLPIWNMVLFAQEYLLDQKFLKLYVQDKIIASGDYRRKNTRAEENKIINYKNIENLNLYHDDYLVTIVTFNILKESNYSEGAVTKMLGFKIFEKIDQKSGSEISLAFENNLPRSYEFLQYSPLQFTSLYSVRDIIIKDYRNYFTQTRYCGLNINFLNPESDRILNIARSKLIEKQKNAFNKIFFKKILPKVLPQVKALFEQGFDKLTRYFDEQTLQTVYFNLKLTFITNKLDTTNFDQKYYNDLILPEEIIASYSDGLKNYLKLEAHSLFEVKDLVLNTLNSTDIQEILKLKDSNFVEDDINLLKKSYSKTAFPKFSALLKEKPIIWMDAYLRIFLVTFYKLKGFLFTDSGFMLGKELFLCPEKVYNNILLDDNDKAAFYKTYLYGSNHVYLNSTRLIIYPIEPYASILAIKKTQASFVGYFPSYTDHGIISPFESRKVFRKIVDELQNLIIENDTIKIKEKIKNDYIDALINNRIIQFIIENSSKMSIN